MRHLTIPSSLVRGRYIPGRSLDYRAELAARSAVLIPVPYLCKGCETMYEHQPRIGKRTQHRDQAHWVTLDILCRVVVWRTVSLQDNLSRSYSTTTLVWRLHEVHCTTGLRSRYGLKKEIETSVVPGQPKKLDSSRCSQARSHSPLRMDDSSVCQPRGTRDVDT